MLESLPVSDPDDDEGLTEDAPEELFSDELDFPEDDAKGDEEDPGWWHGDASEEGVDYPDDSEDALGEI